MRRSGRSRPRMPRRSGRCVPAIPQYAAHALELPAGDPRRRSPGYVAGWPQVSLMPALMSRPPRVMARDASAVTAIATIARSAIGSGRTTARNWSARARSNTASRRPALGRQRQQPLTPVGDLLGAAQQARAARAPSRSGWPPTGSGPAARPGPRPSMRPVPATAYSVVICRKPRPWALSWAANP